MLFSNCVIPDCPVVSLSAWNWQVINSSNTLAADINGTGEANMNLDIKGAGSAALQLYSAFHFYSAQCATESKVKTASDVGLLFRRGKDVEQCKVMQHRVQGT